eukprot:TRINITY_DN5520_c0_g1_i2.p1 TRINITY_DN5520_c0_g1~~TRINITY_DN5520_c0_g1_i2.p1  ORF type:complete len:367 (+),score=83.29 TRINITY_DN5520_c0_g1_i2:44-1144(+)
MGFTLFEVSGTDRPAHQPTKPFIYFLLSVSVAALIVGAIALHEALEANDNDVEEVETVPLFQDKYSIPAKAYVAEGIAWDPIAKRFLFGSIATGAISTITPEPPGRPYSIQPLVPPNNLAIGSIGLYVDAEGPRYNLWAALGPFPPNPANTVQGGILYRNMITGKQIVADVTSLRGSVNDAMLINDIVADGNGVVYATNSLDGMILKGVVDETNDRIDVTVFFNNPEYRFTNPGDLGFNGIEFVGGVILVGTSQPASNKGGLLRISSTNPNDAKMVQVTKGTIEYVDGLRFNPSKSILYVVKSPNAVQVVQSKDNWVTAEVVEEIPIPSFCEAPLTTVAYIPDDSSLFAVCAGGFGNGPYSISRII